MLHSLHPSLKRMIPTTNACAIITRLKSKKKGYKYKFGHIRHKSDPHEIAREYFDEHYSNYFGTDWPSIRCAMLSRKKYCCILNNFVNVDEYERQLVESGAYNFVKKMNKKAEKMLELLDAEGETITKQIAHLQSTEHNLCADERELDIQHEDIQQLTEKLEKVTDKIEAYEHLSNTCSSIRAYVYPRENLAEFKLSTVPVDMMPIHQNYLLDGASVIPVLALAPENGDDILDMCAAPGGKLMTMLQHVGAHARLVANDGVKSRHKQIKGVMDQYLPKDCKAREMVKTVAFNGKEWSEVETQCYNKVLVDVPCTNDRLSMYESEIAKDNIFFHLRKNERAQLPELQAALLKNAVLACNIGGTIVYSTCTASQWQNEFVVQYTVQELLDKHGVECEVESLKPLSSLLEDEFNFYANSTLGALVQPHLEANFGPMFICKLTRNT